MMRHLNSLAIGLLSIAVATGLSTGAWAVPYASGIHNIGGDTWQLVLNQDADSVTISRDGGNEIVINSAAAGRHDFDMTGFSNFEIAVANDDPAGWTMISDPTNLFTNFPVPSGLAINTDPASLYFGTVYVANANPTSPTPLGRTVGDGVYALTADLVGVDLASSFAVVTDVNDASQAKAPGWTVSGSNSSSPWRMTLDDANNLIVSDWSDASGGIKYASPDLTTGGLILEGEDGIRPLLLDIATNTHEIHGSIASKAYVTGSVGNNLVVYAMDEDYDLDGDTLNATSGNNVWRWDVGNVTDYDQSPVLVIATGAVTTFLDLNIGVSAKIHYDSQYDNWYLTQYRFDGDQTGLVVIDADGPGADLLDPNAPNVLFDSLTYSMDNMLDGNTATAATIQDVFRLANDTTISNDGTQLILHRIGEFGANPVLGDGAVVIIPLDANGVPDIQIDDNGTPADPSDDFFANVETITITNNNAAHTLGTSVKFDVAGNLYTTSSSSDLLEVFSPGGNTLATTTSAGTFSVVSVVGVPGDYNENGIVDAADYTVWRDRLGQAMALPNTDPTDVDGMVTQDEYTFWKSNFGNSGSGSLAGGAVPEPGTSLLAVVGMLALSWISARSLRRR